MSKIFLTKGCISYLKKIAPQIECQEILGNENFSSLAKLQKLDLFKGKPFFVYCSNLWRTSYNIFSLEIFDGDDTLLLLMHRQTKNLISRQIKDQSLQNGSLIIINELSFVKFKKDQKYYYIVTNASHLGIEKKAEKIVSISIENDPKILTEDHFFRQYFKINEEIFRCNQSLNTNFKEKKDLNRKKNIFQEYEVKKIFNLAFFFGIFIIWIYMDALKGLHCSIHNLKRKNNVLNTEKNNETNKKKKLTLC